MFACVHVHTCECYPFKFTPCPLYVNDQSHPIWLGKGSTRGKSCHVSQAVTKHPTEEDLRDANERRWQHWRRLQDNVPNRNNWAWVQIGWQRLGHTEGKPERCWYGRMMYNFLKLMCSSLKSFTTCLPWLPLLIRHPDSPIIICNMYFSNQMALACILTENNMKNTRGKKTLCWLETHSYATSKPVTSETTLYPVVTMKITDFKFALNATTTNLENKIQRKEVDQQVPIFTFNIISSEI